MENRIRVFLIDNRDSFTFNLAQAFLELSVDVHTVSVFDLQNGSHRFESEIEGRLEKDEPCLLCLGPGPRGPESFPALQGIIGRMAGRLPVLGVCLGMQAIVHAFGGEVALAAFPVHGKRSKISHKGRGLFDRLPSPMEVMRYHSMVVKSLPPGFQMTAHDDESQIMAIENASLNLLGVQFHPESIGTEGGLDLLANALAMAGSRPEKIVYRAGGIPPPGAFIQPGWRQA
jgi:anthranilate synthase/aminodeoxychorismate synthase-like glutamine amidotransferase